MMIKNPIQNRQAIQAGFSLIELMISMALGLFLMAGVFTVFINTRDSQDIVADQVTMMDNARFALETIGYDLRHTGNFGRTNENQLVDISLVQGQVANDCGPVMNFNGDMVDWVTNTLSWVYAYNDSTSDGTADISSCTTGYANGDIIEARYALNKAVTVLQSDKLYVNGDLNASTYFIGSAPPDASKPVYEAVSNAYYVSSYSYSVGDGIPSLRRVSLQPGPTVTDEMILSGVENMQVMIGLDVDNDGTVDTYADPARQPGGLAWLKARSIQIWLVVRSNDIQRDLDTSTNFDIAGQQINYPNDGYRRIMLSTVVALRNSKPLTGGS